ncbi:hypothetical protein RPPS3_40690 [Rhodopseudomonas palustris]|uniref:glycosyltransferase family protein n=1 Tax=Rhodopseudomonas palustris TaxID=1076 RepID=UPI000D1A8542|nr:glycosyltransferase [Rhodopseudomonas palustris]AVT78131.1 hypothetical protein RPPS3_40690 [Rhodopseudomonas palustris]
MPPIRRVLALSHFNVGINRVFEDYCNGISANASEYHFIDYVDAYRKFGHCGFEDYIERFAAKHGITHVVFVWWSCDLTFDPTFLARLASKARLVMNFFDTEYFFEGVDRYLAQSADLVMLPDELSRHRYEHLGIPAHTSFALFDRHAYRRDPEIRPDIDVAFVGNIKQADRAEYIHFLKSNGIRVEAFGHGTDNGFVDFDDMVRLFNRARINLNFTGTSNFDNYAITLPRINQRIRQSKGRPIEIALSGGFILSQYAVGIEAMFEPGREFDVFRTKEELLSKVRHYLDHEDERSAMALRAHERAIANYDTERGFAKIFAKLDSLPRQTPTSLYLDKEFRRNYVAFRFFYLALFLLEGKFARAVEELSVGARTGRIAWSAAYHFFIRGVLHFLREHPRLEAIAKGARSRLPWIRIKY